MCVPSVKLEFKKFNLNVYYILYCDRITLSVSSLKFIVFSINLLRVNEKMLIKAYFIHARHQNSIHSRAVYFQFKTF